MKELNQGGISVIMPVYKVSEYIEESIKSLINQDYDNYEIILVDDGSPDDSIEKGRSILEGKNVEYTIIHQENKGLPAARNTGINNAKGEYVCFIDSDDIIDSAHLRRLRESFLDENIQFTFSDFEVTDLENREGKKCEKGNVVILTSSEIKKSFLERKIPIHCCATMFKKRFLIKNNLLFNENLKYGEDVEFLWRMLSHIRKCAHYEEKSYKYLCRPNSLMTNQNLDKIIIFMSEFKKTIKETNYKYDAKQIIVSRTFFGICHSCAKNSEYELFKKLIEDTDIIKDINTLNKLKDIRIIILWDILRISPKLFWKICKYI